MDYSLAETRYVLSYFKNVGVRKPSIQISQNISAMLGFSHTTTGLKKLISKVSKVCKLSSPTNPTTAISDSKLDIILCCLNCNLFCNWCCYKAGASFLLNSALLST